MSERNIIFFDLETTGTSINNDRIVQICCLKTNQNLKVIEPPKNILLNPCMPIPKEASDVHGITDDMIIGKNTFQQISKSLSYYFFGCDLAGYNIINFDIPLLMSEFDRCKIEFEINGIEIYDSYKIFANKEKRDLTAALKFYTGEEMKGAHDALNDVLATTKIFGSQILCYGMSLEDACKESREKDYVDLTGKLITNSNGEVCYNIGKEKNTPVTFNRGFGLWMLRNDFPVDTKKIIKKLLNIK